MQFAVSNAYYSHDLEGYEELYEQVNILLEKDKARFTKEIEEDKATKDSILEVNRARVDSLKKLGKDKYGKQIKNVKKEFTEEGPLKSIDSSL